MPGIIEDILEEDCTPKSEAEELEMWLRRLREPGSRVPGAGLKLTLNPHQSKVITAPDRGKGEILYSGGVGAGKSCCLCLALLRYVSVPGTVALLTRKNYSDLRKSTLQELLRPKPNADGSLRPPLLPEQCIRSYNKNDGIISLHNGSQIIMIGAADPEKVKSIQATAGFVDEASECEEEEYTTVMQRCRLPGVLPNAVFAVTNPKTRNHWLWRRFVEDEVASREMVSTTIFANAHLPAAFVRQQLQEPDAVKEWAVWGRWTASGEEVFTSFSDACVAPDPGTPADDTLVCQDYGGGAGGSGMVVLRKRGMIYHAVAEFFEAGPSHSRVLEWMERWRDESHGRVVYDPANAAIATDMINRGWTCLKPVKDIESGVGLLNSRFGDRRLFVDPVCVNLIRQLKRARRAKTGIAIKSTDWDVADALRYGMMVFAGSEKPVPRPLSMPFYLPKD